MTIRYKDPLYCALGLRKNTKGRTTLKKLSHQGWGSDLITEGVAQPFEQQGYFLVWLTKSWFGKQKAASRGHEGAGDQQSVV